MNFSTSSISLLMGQPDGSFVSAAMHGAPIDLGARTAFLTWGLVSADYNGDAKPDLAIAGGSPVSVPGKMTMLMSPLSASPPLRRHRRLRLR